MKTLCSSFFHFKRFGSRIDEQNGDAKKSFVRSVARLIMWVGAEMEAQTTIQETETPEVMEVLM
jgi:hypothetical protein